jgi:hypothetical protein
MRPLLVSSGKGGEEEMIEVEFCRGDVVVRVKLDAALLVWVVIQALVLADTHWVGYLS